MTVIKVYFWTLLLNEWSTLAPLIQLLIIQTLSRHLQLQQGMWWSCLLSIFKYLPLATWSLFKYFPQQVNHQKVVTIDWHQDAAEKESAPICAVALKPGSVDINGSILDFQLYRCCRRGTCPSFASDSEGNLWSNELLL